MKDQDKVVIPFIDKMIIVLMTFVSVLVWVVVIWAFIVVIKHPSIITNFIKNTFIIIGIN